jgi:hypothetical protein
MYHCSVTKTIVFGEGLTENAQGSGGTFQEASAQDYVIGTVLFQTAEDTYTLPKGYGAEAGETQTHAILLISFTAFLCLSALLLQKP